MLISTRSRAIRIGLGMLAALSIVLWFSRSRPTVAPTATTSAQGVADPDVASMAHSDSLVGGARIVVTNSDAPATAETTIVWVVVDARNVPVVGAIAFACDETVRSVALAGAHVLARSDESGRLVLSSELNVACLAISCEGFVSTTVPFDRGQKTRVVVLDSGHTLEIWCKDSEDSPVGGCAVIASRAALSARTCATAAVDSLPAGRPEHAVYAAMSGKDGHIILRGLTVGIYAFNVQSDDFALLDWQPFADMTVPGPDLHLRLGRHVAAVLRIEGDESLASAATYGEGYALSGPMMPAVDRVRSDLNERYPDHVVLNAVRVSASEARPVALRLFLAERGEQTFQVPLISLSEITAPVPLDVSVRPRIELAPVELELVNALGRPSRLPDFYVSLGKNLFDGSTIKFDGRPKFLPPGTRELKHKSGWLKGHFHPTVLKIPGVNRVQIDQLYRPCELRIQTPWGDPAPYAKVTFRIGEQQQSFFDTGPAPRVNWLPVGPLTVSVEVGGCEPAELSTKVEDSATEEVQIVEIAVHGSQL